MNKKNNDNFQITEQEKQRIENQDKEYHKSILKFLNASTPDELYQALEQNEFIFVEETKEGKEVIKKLLENNNEKVEMGIAKFYEDDEFIGKLFFKTSSEKVKKICLQRNWGISGNPYLFPPLWHNFYGPLENTEFDKFLQNASDEELYLYFTNQNFKLWECIRSVVNKEWPYNKISRTQYENIILILENNPNTFPPEPDMFDEKYTRSTEGSRWFRDIETFEMFHSELIKIKKLRDLKK